MLTTYFYLLLAVLSGASSNHFAKNAYGFTKFFPSLLSIISIILCMYLLSQVMKTISAGITYATFAGLCIITTVCFDIIRFNLWPNIFSLAGIVIIIIGVILVNTLGNQ